MSADWRYHAKRGVSVVCALLLIVLSGIRPATAGLPQVAATVRALLTAPTEEIDFARAKLSIDRLIDPAIDRDRALADIDRKVAAINRMLATLPAAEASTSIAKLNALRAFLYRSSRWNGGRQFHYDMSDPLGQNPTHDLLTSYLASRKGNCVSMPILFVILGERLGLNVTLSTAPLHVLVKYTDAQSGVTYNLEATSGGGFTRDAWYRQNLPMTDVAIANGVYLKTLSRREALAVMATSLVDHLLISGRYEEAIAVTDAILEAYPAHAFALVKKATGYYRLLRRDIIDRYPDLQALPPDVAAYATRLYRRNQEAFAQAEALGWREPEEVKQIGTSN